MKHLTFQNNYKHFLSLIGLVFFGMIMFIGNTSANSNVFYSISPYGTGDIKVASNITITNGVATLTQAQTGNIGTGVEIEYNSLKAYIAPNRIPFTSGGATELEPGTKIEGDTSGATGIIRTMETTSGTWANGDAVGWIYFEKTTGTFNASEQINRTKPTAIDNIATTNGTIQGNINNGNTEFVVKTATGGTPPNQTEIAITSIHHVWDSLFDFEANFTGLNYINNTDLTLAGADVIAHAVCYYDHDDQTADITAVEIDFGTTGEDNYLQIYTPIGEAESLNKQRHEGVWEDEKYRLTSDDYLSTIFNYEAYIRIEGIQIENTGTTSGWRSGFKMYTGAGDVGDVYIQENIVRKTNVYANGDNQGIGLEHASDGWTYYIINNIIYDFNRGIYLNNEDNEKEIIYNNTVTNCVTGFNIALYGVNDELYLKNNLAFSNGDDYSFSDSASVSNIINNAYSEGTDPGTGGVNISSYAGTDLFTDCNNDNFHLKSGTTVINAGADLSSDPNLPFTTDIDSHTRPTNTLWDIGADEELSIAFTSTSSSSTEGTTPITIEITLSEIYSSDSTIDYTITNGTATGSGTDYTLANGTATIIAGNTTTTIPITITEDNIDEANETIEITLSNPTNAILGTNTIHTYTITDNDTAGITITPTTGSTSETGTIATYTAVLNTEPTNGVSFNITSQDTTEGTVLPASLTFTSSDWSTPQTVTITGVDDNLQDGNITYTITNATATSTDSNYNIDPNDISITNQDNDTAGITITESNGSTTITEGGTTDTYTIVLNTEPTNNTTITITTDAQSTTDSATLTFTNLNWNNPQTVTITAIDDADIEGDHTSTITNTSTSSDSNYNNISIPNITANITDNDFASSSGLPSSQTPPTPPSPTPNNPMGGFKATIIQQTQDNNNQNITLKLTAGPNTKSMSISNNPDFQDTSIIPYQEEIKLSEISPTLFDKEGVPTSNLYIRFYTQYGVPSETITIETETNNPPDNLNEGDIIMGPDKIKVYIINSHKYKRHIFNPDIFKMYHHLKWENIKQVSQEILDIFTISNLYKSPNDHKIYSLEEINEAKGKAIKHNLNLTPEEFEKEYDYNKVFEVNREERDYYEMGEDEE